jgi:hypothetical protein
MKGYSETHGFLPEEVALFEKAKRLVGAVEDDRETRIRSHELARAVGQVLRLPVVDGVYGAVDHSWCLVERTHGPMLRTTSVLDVYCVGRLPQVQLVDVVDAVLGHRGMYQERARREDIDARRLMEIVAVMRAVAL